MERMTAHFWVSGELYEVDYFKALGDGGRAKFFKVYKSERRCRCPDREALEQRRREVRSAESA
jgi:hypothetical protein